MDDLMVARIPTFTLGYIWFNMASSVDGPKSLYKVVQRESS